MSTLALLLAGIVASGGPGVPPATVERARAVLETALAGFEGDVRLRLYRTRREMEAAAPTAPAGHLAFYHEESRTVFAWLAPRPDAVLFENRLPGILTGALVHEAQHARGVPEGAADREAVRLLRGAPWPGARAWELLLESRVDRARRAGLFLKDEEEFRRVDPNTLSLDQRATWYAQAYALARGPREGPPLPWVLWSGCADPIEGGYRLVSGEGGRALLLRRRVGPLEVAVEPLPVGRGEIELVFGFESLRNHARIVLNRAGVVRVLRREAQSWVVEAQGKAPPLAAGRRTVLALRDGEVSVGGRVVARVRARPGQVGIGVSDSAADFFTASS